ncbi:MAG: PHP domain-containing protein [Anaerolineae bacterium]
MSIAIRPLVLAQGTRAHLHISGLTPGRAYGVALLPTRRRDLRMAQHLVADEQGNVSWIQSVSWQGEAICDVTPADEPGGEVGPTEEVRVYAAPPDLAARRPLRCDLHIHTTYSDGRADPTEMVVLGRELGLDVLAITDHNRYPPSLEAIAAAQRLGLGLLCLPGEEVTTYNWHLLAIGTSAGVGCTAEDAGYARLRTAMDTIHALGGKAYLAHPYWTYARRHHLPTEDYDRLLEEGGLDGIELLGDVDWEDNLRSVMRYVDVPPVARLPILGNSDTHWPGPTYGDYWTLAWADTLTPEGVLGAIAARRSVACARMPLAPSRHDVEPRLLACGPYEQMDMALYLDRHYYPLHDDLCRREAGLARRILAGDVDVHVSAVAQAARQVEDLYRACWQIAAD